MFIGTPCIKLRKTMNKGSCILVKYPVIQKLELKISLPAADIVDMNDGKSLLNLNIVF